MRTRVRGWRWRRNTLRRRSDVVEAWTALLVTVLLFVGAPLAGLLVGWWAHDEARSVAAAERAERHRVRAEVVGTTPDQLPSVQGGREHSFRVDVRWTDPVTGPHTTRARVPAGTRHGDTVDVWFDAQNRTVPAPPGPSQIWQHTVTVGICVSGGTIAVVLLANAVVQRVALGRRLTEWDTEWVRTEPLWTRRQAGGPDSGPTDTV
ncbi:Rv1733c family protein [Streptomyces sp. CA-249302]|uniref:Rv1733c family protein n=1 Tax=Streptomyces sp. CA-249302 TaxID=3240058 RepID=UPI003D8B65E3